MLTNGNATVQNKDRFDGTIESDVQESTLRKLLSHGIDESDTVKDIGIEIDRNSLTLTEQYTHRIFVTVTASVVVPFFKTIKLLF